MRIIGRLPDPRMQITVFENDGRFPVQFELGGITQVYRFRKGEGLGNFGQLRAYVDETFRAAVLEQFSAMRRIHTEVLQRIQPPESSQEGLPNII